MLLVIRNLSCERHCLSNYFLIPLFRSMAVKPEGPMKTASVRGKSTVNIRATFIAQCRSQWPCGLRRRSSAARLLRSWVGIPPGHGCLSIVSVVCCQIEVSATD